MTVQPTLVRRWDPVVRITHWSVALGVLANALITEEGSGPHVWVGYALAALLALRFLWGFIGPAEARFSAFRPSPRKALAHLREIRAGMVTHHPSHNPLGALMVYAIWTCLLTIIATGTAMAGPPAINEPGRVVEAARAAITAPGLLRGGDAGEEDAEEDAGQADEEDEDHWEGPLDEIHEVAANLLYLLVLLHLAGVIFETRRSGRQVLVAMALPRR